MSARYGHRGSQPVLQHAGPPQVHEKGADGTGPHQRGLHADRVAHAVDSFHPPPQRSAGVRPAGGHQLAGANRQASGPADRRGADRSGKRRRRRPHRGLRGPPGPEPQQQPRAIRIPQWASYPRPVAAARFGRSLSRDADDGPFSDRGTCLGDAGRNGRRERAPDETRGSVSGFRQDLQPVAFDVADPIPVERSEHPCGNARRVGSERGSRRSAHRTHPPAGGRLGEG